MCQSQGKCLKRHIEDPLCDLCVESLGKVGRKRQSPMVVIQSDTTIPNTTRYYNKNHDVGHLILSGCCSSAKGMRAEISAI